MTNKQQRNLKCLCIRLLRVQDKAHSIALGFTVGLLINFIPSFGLGPFFSTVIAKLMKGNSIAGFIGGVSFLWAFPFLFYLNVVVGETLLPISVNKKMDMAIEQFEKEGQKQEVIYQRIEVHPFEHFQKIISASLKIGKAFLLGMVVNIILFGTVCYWLTYYIIIKYRRDALKLIRSKWNPSKRAKKLTPV